MKFRQMLTAFGVIGCLSFSTLSAQPPESEGGRRGREGRQRDGQPRDGQQAREGQRNRQGDEGGRPQGPPDGRGGGPAFLLRLPVMAALDQDQDGVISAEEIANATAALKTLDKNGDGKLTIEEIRPQGPPDGRPGQPGDRREPGAGDGQRPGGGQGPEFLLRMFEQRDANGDGKLSGDELPEQLAGRMERLDTNGDGAIDKEELKQMRQMLQGQRPGGNRPNREGGEPAGDGSGVKPKRP